MMNTFLLDTKQTDELVCMDHLTEAVRANELPTINTASTTQATHDAEAHSD